MVLRVCFRLFGGKSDPIRKVSFALQLVIWQNFLWILWFDILAIKFKSFFIKFRSKKLQNSSGKRLNQTIVQFFDSPRCSSLILSFKASSNPPKPQNFPYILINVQCSNMYWDWGNFLHKITLNPPQYTISNPFI